MKRELCDYCGGDAYPFHMPGHKRQLHNDKIPYNIDITEIDGFDNLHHPEGLIRELEQKAARLYHAEQAFLLVNGATGGILSAIRAVTHRNDRVIMARNCHTSVYHAMELLGLRPVYLMPEPDKYDIYGAIDSCEVEKLLCDYPDTRLVIITSPTYEGICSDIQTIAGICRRHNARLLVDEAHGAHFPFHPAFPHNAMQCGADLSVVSLHKTMPALTQTALLLTSDETMVQPLRSASAIFQTSSPSYVLMASIETALNYPQQHPRVFDEYVNRLHDFVNAVSSMRHLRLLPRNQSNVDCSKLMISTFGTNISGIQLADILRKNYDIEVEMAALHYVIAMTSVCDTPEGFDRLKNAVLDIDSQCSFNENNCVLTLPSEIPNRSCYSCETEAMPKRPVPFSESTGAVSAEDIFAYPPGIPLIVKGEVVTQTMLKTINQLSGRGVNIISSENSYPDSLFIIDKNRCIW